MTTSMAKKLSIERFRTTWPSSLSRGLVMLKYSKAEYIYWDPFSGDKDDGFLRCRTVDIVKTRSVHKCICSEDMHEIPVGTLVRREKAILADKWESWYACIDCIDKELDDVGI